MLQSVLVFMSAVVVCQFAATIAEAQQPATKAPASQFPASQISPPTPPQTAAIATQWQIQCEGAGTGLDCRVSRNVMMQQTGRRLVAVVLRRPSKTEPPALMLHLPHGLFLPAGATLQVDATKSEALQLQTCDDKGCYAGVTMRSDLLAQFQKGTMLTVAFQDLQKRTISVPVPLAGFSEAYQKLP
jgi:invasion protein IalB